MDLLLVLAIFIAIVWIVLASFKRISVLLSAPIATLIVIILGRFDIISSLFGDKGSYISFLTSFVFNFFFIFVLGSVMAKYLQKSGAIDTITLSVTKIVNIDNPMHGMLAVYFITALLTYGGVSLFVVMFAVVPLARALFRHMNIPWKLSPIPIILGLGTFTASMLPGSPSVINIIPTNTLNTSLMAAPIVGIVASMVSIISAIGYMYFVVKNDKKSENNVVMAQSNSETRDNRPNLFTSLLPLITLIVLIIIGSAIKIPQVLSISLVIVIVLEMIIFRPYVSSHIETLNTGTTDALVPLLSTASTIAFGQYVANISSIFGFTRKLISDSNSKLLIAAILTIVFSVITGSGSGAIGIMIPAHGEFLLSAGISADFIHRILAIASTVMPNTPHSGVVIALLSLSNLTHKESFKHVFLAPTVTGLLALLVSFLMISI